MPAYIQWTVRVSKYTDDFIREEKEENPRKSSNDIINELIESAIKERIRKRRKKSNAKEDNS